MTLTADQFTNFAASSIKGGAGGSGTSLGSGDTSLLLQTGDGALFPSSGPFAVLIGTVAGSHELVRCTSRSSDTLTLVRAQEGTSATTWPTSTAVTHVATAGSMSNIWAALQGTTGLQGGWASSLILPQQGLITEHIVTAVQDKILNIATTSSQTLCNYSGAGIMRGLWLALGGASGPVLDGRIKITVDGTLVVDVDCGTMFLIHGGTTMAMACNHMSAEYTTSGPDAALAWTFPVPFTTSLLVEYYNPQSATLPSLYSRVAYSTATPPPGLAIKSYQTRFYPTPLALTSGQGTTFFDFSGKGWLAWFSMYSSGSNQTFLERPISCYVDGEGSPSYTSSGTEDFFQSGWYGESRSGVSKPWGVIGTNTSTTAGFGLDLLALHGGIRFETECKLTWDVDSDVTTSSNTSFFALLYTGI